jgi:cell wall-associated NlpC family hydrolase
MDHYTICHSILRRRAVPAVGTQARRRAVALLVSCLTVAGVSAFSHGEAGVPLAGAPDQGAADLLHAARAQLGDPYLWGANGPDAWDCSGLTRLWRGVPGVEDMPRVSRDQQRWAVPIPREQLMIGDLVFFNEPVDHVAIYAGDGRIVDASSARAGVVERPLWRATVVRYGRVPRPGMPEVQPWTPPPLPVAEAGPDPQVGIVPTAPPTAAPRASRNKSAAAGAPGKGPSTSTAKAAGKAAGTSAGKAAAKPFAKPVAKPEAKGAAKAVAKGAAKAVAKPTAQPVAAPAARRAPASSTGAARSAASEVPAPLSGLPAEQLGLSSPLAYAAAALAKAQVGEPAGPGGWTDVDHVATSWRAAGGRALPADRDALVALGRPVALPDARIGDLVVYGRPAVPHLGVYLGGGQMVDASPKQGRVVIRPVYSAQSVRLVRLG